jgi:hypothetical protein
MIDINEIMLFLKITQINFPKNNSKKIKNGLQEKVLFLETNQMRLFKHDEVSDSKSIQNYSENPEMINFICLNDYSRENKEKRSIHQNNLLQFSSFSKKSANELKKNNWIKLVVREYEIDEIILAKRKRSDEKLKHSYKPIYHGIKDQYERILKQNNEFKKLTPKQFNLKLTRYLFSNNTKFDCIYSKKSKMNVTKKLIVNLKMNKRYVRMMNEYIHKKFMIDEIENNISNKIERIMEENLSYESFLNLLMTKVKKNGWLLQNSLNSLDEIINCNSSTILKKRIKKKRSQINKIPYFMV